MRSAWIRRKPRSGSIGASSTPVCAPTPDGTRPAGQLHVAIIGAGTTGTELSAELHRTVRGVAAFGLDKIDPDQDIKITLIEAADRVVPALAMRVSGPLHGCSANSA